DLLAAVRQGLGQLDDARQDVGVALDALRLAHQLLALAGAVLVRGPGQRDELRGVERGADATMTRLAGGAENGNVVGLDIVAHDRLVGGDGSPLLAPTGAPRPASDCLPPDST